MNTIYSIALLPLAAVPIVVISYILRRILGKK